LSSKRSLAFLVLFSGSSVAPANSDDRNQSSGVSNTLPRLYAQAKDLQATLDRAEYLGAKTILPPTEVPGGPKLAMFSDPAGNITGLLMRK